MILSGLPLTGDHPMHPFAIDAEGGLLSISAPRPMPARTKIACRNRRRRQPCTELETRGGIWRYDANKTAKISRRRSVSPLGYAMAKASLSTAGRLFATQHGRDQLHAGLAELYTPNRVRTCQPKNWCSLKRGADYGWPECYFDGYQQKLVLAPEYGGDGGKKIGICAEKRAPVAAFPAHWAPNDMKIYDGTQFPGGLSRRRLHRLPRLLEPRPGAAGRL